MTKNTVYFIMALFIGLLAYDEAAGRDLKITTVGGRECYVYDVKKGENIYDVSRELGIPTVEITRYNPSAADGLRAGMSLYVPVAIVDRVPGTVERKKETVAASTTVHAAPVQQVERAESEQSHSTGVETYTVKRGESLYGISHKFGVTMEDLIALNPSAEYGVKSGDVLVIRASGNRHDATEVAQAQEPEPAVVDDGTMYSLAPGEQRITDRYVVRMNDYEDTDSTNASGSEMDADTLNIAVMLPFMLHEDEQSKNAQLFLEFYKGFLLAVDSLKNAGGNHINVYAYDTAASADTIMSIMEREEMRDMDLIVGPDNDSHLQLIAEAMSNKTHLYNTFNVRSTLYTGNEHVIQANIPHTPMLTKAVDAFCEMYRNYTPVFLSRIDGAADKDAFTSLLKQRLDRDTVEYREFTFRNLLSHRDIDTLSVDLNYVFVPVSGSRAEFAKISEAIRRFGEARPERSTRLFGYPDWIVFRGEYFNRLGELEATIYTRFYADMSQPETMAVTEMYKDKYGSEMLDAAPVQGLLGFDTGMYLLQALKDYGSDFADNLKPYTGLQSVMNFEQKPGEGDVNNSLLIVTFTPTGSTIKTTLE